MVPFGGYEMPVSYPSGIAAEHRALHERVGVFDVSHMGEFEVSGPDRNAFVQRVTCNDVGALRPGQAQYSAILTDQGTFVDDCLVYRFEDRVMLVVNAANIAQDWEHIVAQKRGANVRLRDISDETGLLAVQGPAAETLLAPLTPVGVAMIPYYHFAQGKVAGVQCFISRTGYTGEDGFELYARAADTETLWHALVGTGRAEPCGLGARDTLRLEAGYPLYGSGIGAGGGRGPRGAVGPGRARYAAARGGVPAVRQRHRRRCDALRGGPRLDREARQGSRLHRARRAQAPEARGREAAAGGLQAARAQARRAARLRRVSGWGAGGRRPLRHRNAHHQLRHRDDLSAAGAGQAGHRLHNRYPWQAGGGGGGGAAVRGAQNQEIGGEGRWRAVENGGGMRIGILTVSDLGALGQRADTSGDAIAGWAAEHGYEVVVRSVVPDETDRIAGKLARWADSGEVDVVLTTGGTGLTARDVTPEATEAVLDRLAPGIAEALRCAAAPAFPRAWLSRGN